MKKNEWFFFILVLLFCLPWYCLTFPQMMSDIVTLRQMCVYYAVPFVVIQFPTFILLFINHRTEETDENKERLMQNLLLLSVVIEAFVLNFLTAIWSVSYIFLMEL